MTFGLTIAGVSKNLRAGSLRIRPSANRRGIASFDVVSLNASYRPARNDDVVITVDGVRVFAGLINKPSERGILDGAKPGIVTQVSAVDYTIYAERRLIVGGGFPAGTTFKDALTSLGSWLTPYGVTLDVAQVTGPTLPEMLFPRTYVRDALDAVVSLTPAYGEPYVWEIDEYKVLRAFQPSTSPAPFDILTDAPGYVIGDITVEPTQDGYANRVYAFAVPKQETGRVETLPVGDGTTDTFPLIYTPTTFRGYVTSDGALETLNRVGDADDATWTYDSTTNSVTRNATHADGTPAGPPAVGVVSTIGFDGTYSGVAVAEDASVFTDPSETSIDVDDVDNPGTLQAAADAALAEALLIPLTVKYRTLTMGLRVGQQQTVTVPARAINAPGLITDLSYFDQTNRLWCDVTVLTGAQSNLKRGYKNTVRNWSGGSAGGSSTVSVGTGGTVSSGPGVPVTSVQYHKEGGVFGGNEHFTFKEATRSLIAGESSTITSVRFMSCFVLGDDCHIADP